VNVVSQVSAAALSVANSRYLSGFGNGFETEALPGALPVGRNSPQKCPYGLYAEQLSGSPFTAPRTTNERSWLYRVRPTVAHWGRFEKADARLWRTAPAPEVEMPLAPLRWDPIPLPKDELSLVEGVHTITTAGDAGSQAGMGAHVYLVTRSMADEYFYNADGEMLVVPQQGELRFWTEFGIIEVEPGEIAVIPRGVKIRVELMGAPRAAISARIMAAPSRFPSAGPSVPTAWRTSATSWPRSRPTRTRTRARSCT
jgi:homogentisate 1,2-dioxygenase